MKLAAQFYTVREFTKTLPALEESIQKAAQIGYPAIQLSATCPYPPEWMAEQLERAGLICACTHTNLERLAKVPAQVAAEHRLYNCRNIGVGCMPRPTGDLEADYRNFAQTFVPVAEALSHAGAKLMYHNHDFEFKVPGKNLLDRMIEDFPDDLEFILDTFWLAAAGEDPAAWIQKLSGRVRCIHFKDMAFVDGQRKMAVVGEGTLDFASILEACKAAGTEYIIVEQDDCNGEDPFECLRRSYQNLQQMNSWDD